MGPFAGDRDAEGSGNAGAFMSWGLIPPVGFAGAALPRKAPRAIGHAAIATYVTRATGAGPATGSAIIAWPVVIIALAILRAAAKVQVDLR